MSRQTILELLNFSSYCRMGLLTYSQVNEHAQLPCLKREQMLLRKLVHDIGAKV